MKKLTLVVLVVLFGAVGAFAQTASDSLTVTATNQGIFSFNIAAASYAFGTVNANGTQNVGGTELITGSSDATGATYDAPGATTWSAQSAPSRTVRIFNASSVSVIGWGSEDRLSMGIPAVGGGTSCGLKAFGTDGDGGLASCTLGNLIHSMTVGNGTNDVDGDLDFQLRVENTDGTGSNTWTVVLTAAGS